MQEGLTSTQTECWMWSWRRLKVTWTKRSSLCLCWRVTLARPALLSTFLVSNSTATRFVWFVCVWKTEQQWPCSLVQSEDLSKATPTPASLYKLCALLLHEGLVRLTDLCTHVCLLPLACSMWTPLAQPVLKGYHIESLSGTSVLSERMIGEAGINYKVSSLHHWWYAHVCVSVLKVEDTLKDTVCIRIL